MNHLETLSFKTTKTFQQHASGNFNTVPTTTNATGSSRLVEQWEHCSELQGDYVEK